MTSIFPPLAARTAAALLVAALLGLGSLPAAAETNAQKQWQEQKARDDAAFQERKRQDEKAYEQKKRDEAAALLRKQQQDAANQNQKQTATRAAQSQAYQNNQRTQEQQRLDKERQERQRQQDQRRAQFQQTERKRIQEAQQQATRRADTSRMQAANTQRAADQKRRFLNATRNPTPGEIQRGFTGKVTADGRAVIRFQNRILVVPASRVSGLSGRLAKERQQRESRWNAQTQAAMNSRIQRLASDRAASVQHDPAAAQARSLAARLARAGGARPPGGGSAANDNYGKPFTNTRQKEHYERAVANAGASKEPVLMLGKYPNYVRAGFNSQSDTFQADKSFPAREKQYRKDNPGLSDREVAKHMFEQKGGNRDELDKHISGGSRFFLSSPYEEMTSQGHYGALEMEHLEKNGYCLSEDRTEMTKIGPCANASLKAKRP